MTRRFSFLALLSLAFAATAAAEQDAAPTAALEVHVAFGEGMVLQRDAAVPVTGTAAPGALVQVSIADAAAGARANDEGRWTIELPPFRAGGPHTMRIESGDQSLELTDVLVGDVWLAGGQSNMEWPVGQSEEPGRAIEESRDMPEIRFLRVAHQIAEKPQHSAQVSGWRRLTWESAGGTSAVAFNFAREIHRSEGVPIGIIQAPWGGTRIEPWTPRWAFDRSESLQEIRERTPWASSDPESFDRSFDERFASTMQRTPEELAVLTGPGPRDGWQSIDIPAPWERTLGNRDGVAWIARDFELTEADTTGAATLELGPIDDYDRTFVNGVLVGTTGREPADPWMEPRVYEIDAGVLRPGVNTVAVQVLDTGGGGGIHGAASRLRLITAGRTIPLAGAWEIFFDRSARDIEGFPRPRQSQDANRRYPGGMYNAMIAPFDDVPITGVIWYQGEGNAGQPGEYGELFETLITSWRENREDLEMPFLFVQLASFRQRNAEPVDSNWARLREAQASVLDLPATGMAVALDVGDADDIHPRDKRTVGNRLAVAALDIAYSKETRWLGPMPQRIEFDEGSVTVTFDDELAVADDNDLCGFAVAGADGVFHWADAAIDGAELVLTCGAVAEPAHVRYGWADNPCANLIGSGGLPAPPFRTDHLPVIER